MGMDIMSSQGTRPLLVDRVLMEATGRNISVHAIKVKGCRRTGMFEQALCEVVVSPT